MSEDYIGTTIGKFEIMAELGSGGMAEVFKAYQTSLNRHVAIKVIHRFLAKDEAFLARFQREAQNVAALRHPNIVQVYDFDVQDGRPYMVMEFIDGQPLDDLSREKMAGDGWPLADVVQVVTDIGEALAYAHKQEMIHRDIKPANIMWAGATDERYILTDFGLAKMLSGQNFTATGTVVGTPAYMSPEQCQGAAGDARTDIYSLGIVLYELATGQLPFSADTQMGYIMKHVTEPPRPPDKVKPDLPYWLTAVILKAIAKDPHDRYQTLDEMLAELNRADETTMVAPVPAWTNVTGDLKTAVADNLRDTAKNVTRFFKAKTEKMDPSSSMETAKQKAGNVTQFFTSRFKKDEDVEESTVADEESPAADKEDALTASRIVKPPRKGTHSTIQEEILAGLEEAKAVIEAKHDDMVSRRLAATNRVRSKIQEKLEDAVARTARAERKRYTILVTSYVTRDREQATDTAVIQQVAQSLSDIIEQHQGEIVQLLDDGFVSLFETMGGSNETTLQAIEAGLALVAETAVIQKSLPHFNLRVGLHTGIVTVNDLNSEAIDLAKEVARATSFGQVYLSHATYRLVLWEVQTEKQEALETAVKSVPLYAVIN